MKIRWSILLVPCCVLACGASAAAQSGGSFSRGGLASQAPQSLTRGGTNNSRNGNAGSQRALGGGGGSLFGQGGIDALGMAGMSTFFNRGGNGTNPFGNQFGGNNFGANGVNQSFSSGFNRFNNMQDFERGRQDRGRSQRRLQTVYRVGFETPKANSTVVDNRLQRHIKTPAIQGVRIQTASSNDAAGLTAILRGTVATVEDKRLAEQLVLLDPDVASVQNELQVATPSRSVPTNQPR